MSTPRNAQPIKMFSSLIPLLLPAHRVCGIWTKCVDEAADYLWVPAAASQSTKHSSIYHLNQKFIPRILLNYSQSLKQRKYLKVIKSLHTCYRENLSIQTTSEKKKSFLAFDYNDNVILIALCSNTCFYRKSEAQINISDCWMDPKSLVQGQSLAWQEIELL